jgi:hypothetical protein
MNNMNPEIQAYNDLQKNDNKAICDKLAATINSILTQAESKFCTRILFGSLREIRLLATANLKTAFDHSFGADNLLKRKVKKL